MVTLVDNINDMSIATGTNYTAKDFKSDADVRWCAGCGGYSILAQAQRVLAGLGIPKERIVFVSGIGCSSRFPYYMDVYGFHSIHGRALPIASGIKVSRPELSVWVATGDGDCMSIGGNHFIHTLRRNIDINILMFNNEVYALTKGQASPTSKVGQITKTTQLGSIDNQFNPVGLALGSGGTFVARTFDADVKHMQYLYERAAAHKGTAFVEIYTNCVVFNDSTFSEFTDRETKKERTVLLEHGKPLIYGVNNDKGIKLDGFTPVAVSLDDGIHSVDDLLVHNEKDSTLAFILANMTYSDTLPRPYGVFQAIDKPRYEENIHLQIQDQIKIKGEGNLQKLLLGDEYWEIKN
jgi:2-oxoglutarate ferredoxin oxidoreductase subunit beta